MDKVLIASQIVWPPVKVQVANAPLEAVDSGVDQCRARGYVIRESSDEDLTVKLKATGRLRFKRGEIVQDESDLALVFRDVNPVPVAVVDVAGRKELFLALSV